jgi:short-subunit dehydrogenase
MKRYTLITGACGGLGKAFVKILAENKENLILTGTSEKKLQALIEDNKVLFEGLSIKTAVCNLAKKEDRDALVKMLEKVDKAVLDFQVTVQLASAHINFARK